jgi:hypothetical protein
VKAQNTLTSAEKTALHKVAKQKAIPADIQERLIKLGYIEQRLVITARGKSYTAKSMKKANPNDKHTKIFVNEFCNYVVELKGLHNIFKELFENAHAIALMEQTAKAFFDDIYNMLKRYVILEMAKITDRAESQGNQNFTVDNIITSINWPIDIHDNLCQKNNILSTFRSSIKKARDKIIAHNDKKTRLKGISLGAFQPGEDDTFMETLEELANTVHQACLGEIMGEINPIMIGGVLDFKEMLRKAIAFQKLLSESKGDELLKLLTIWRSIP